MRSVVLLWSSERTSFWLYFLKLFCEISSPETVPFQILTRFWLRLNSDIKKTHVSKTLYGSNRTIISGIFPIIWALEYSNLCLFMSWLNCLSLRFIIHYSSRLHVCEIIACSYLMQHETTTLFISGSCNLTPGLMFSFFNRRTNPFGESGGSKSETEGKTKILFQCKIKNIIWKLFFYFHL